MKFIRNQIIPKMKLFYFPGLVLASREFFIPDKKGYRNVADAHVGTLFQLYEQIAVFYSIVLKFFYTSSN